MKIKEFNFKYKKEKQTASFVEFESVEELLDKVSTEDLLKIYNFGAQELAKLLIKNKNPFKTKRKTLRIRLDYLSDEQMKLLRTTGFLDLDQEKIKSK